MAIVLAYISCRGPVFLVLSGLDPDWRVFLGKAAVGPAIPGVDLFFKEER